MQVVVVVKSEIAATVDKRDAIILYMKSGRPFVCEKTPPVELPDGRIQYTLKPRRS